MLLTEKTPYKQLPLMADLAVLATAATNDNLTAGSQFAAPAGDGKWAGSVTEVLTIPNVSFVSLQLGPPGSELRKGMPVHDVSHRLRDWKSTADLVAGLDLVISVDTAVCHLVGAIGKPIWMLNRHDAEWRWLKDRDDCPWYPSMRIFRQPEPHDWVSVIDDVRRGLSRMVR